MAVGDGNGEWATDSNADLNAATKLYIETTSLTGQPTLATGPQLSLGDVIQIKSRRDVSRVINFIALVDQVVSGPSVDYLDINVSPTKLGSVSSFQAGEDCSIALQPPFNGATELWSMPAPTDANDPAAPLDLAFVPLATGQSAELFSVGAGGVLTAQFGFACRIDITLEHTLNISGNNQEVGYTVTDATTLTVGGVGRISNSILSPRSGTFPGSGSAPGVAVFGIGDTIQWTAFEDFSTGGSTATIETFSAIISDVIYIETP